ncbi:E3 ubiquitin-protein ligase [Musa troglodytarum]|uniref:RING-type E3 ubiquitin transferase n=2 Tax=Musa troglodytarum TaxID=320322 RepID=A0A9E7J9I6_9LILI|nr:E3 ubiquitin-protein ligase [Musa troglodytarum]
MIGVGGILVLARVRYSPVSGYSSICWSGFLFFLLSWSGMEEETAKMEKHLSSAAAFVEGGIQDSCDDACSICLEEFCESDPSTVTGCKHEFHLQCILEWCQRSSQCPMCWQSISLKDPTSQELLEAVERERNIRINQTRAATIFRHPALGDFDLQHLGGNDTELEERIMQHLAAAAAMGRVHHISRREGHRGRGGSHRHSQFLVFAPHQNAPYIGYRSSSAQGGDNESIPAIIAAGPPSVLNVPTEESSSQGTHINLAQGERSSAIATEITTSQSRPSLSASRTFAGHSSPIVHDRPGPSDLQSFSESLRSRLNAVSMRYKESITKSTRGWRERLFSRNSSVADLGSEARSDINAGVDTSSRMVDRLETRENRTNVFTFHDAEVHSASEANNEGVTGNHVDSHPSDGTSSAPCCPTSSPN